MSKYSTEEATFLILSTVTTRDYSYTAIKGVELIEEFADGSVLIRPYLTDVPIATGTARKSIGDKTNLDIAIGLSVGRALNNLGKKLTKHSAGLVKHAEDIMVMQAKQKESPKVLQADVKKKPKKPMKIKNIKTTKIRNSTEGTPTHVSGSSTPSHASSPDRTTYIPQVTAKAN